MRCPQCGDEIRNGRCQFCGYRETEEDRAARARFEKQKKAVCGGPGLPQRPRGKPPSKKPPAGARKPEQKQAPPSRDRPKARAPERDPKAVAAKRAEPGERPEAVRPKQGRLKRLLFKLLVLGWILAYVLALYGAWDQRRQQGPPGPAETYETDRDGPSGAIPEGGTE